MAHPDVPAEMEEVGRVRERDRLGCDYLRRALVAGTRQHLRPHGAKQRMGVRVLSPGECLARAGQLVGVGVAALSVDSLGEDRGKARQPRYLPDPRQRLVACPQLLLGAVGIPGD